MIHYDIAGENTDRPALVFVHGLTCAAGDWKNQVADLAPTHRCVSVDLRGHGRSDAMLPLYDMETLAADVVAVLRHLELRNSILIGHSMGTRVIAAAHLQAPEYSSGLVFVDGSKQASGDPQQAANDALLRLQNDAELTEFTRTMFSAMFTDKSCSAEREQIIQRATTMPPNVFRQLLANMLTWDAGRMISVLQQVKIPVSVVQSTNVDENRVRHSMSLGQSTPYLTILESNLSKVDVQVVPDTGHFTQLDSPKSVTEAVVALSESVIAH